MKNYFKLLLGFIGVSMILSCQDKVEETYKVNTPQYLSYDNLRTSFKVTDAEPIKQSGKIYFKGKYIFVNEYTKGIHVIDNTDPSNPQVIKFIEIPGNVDMAVKGNMLYADSYVDLLTIDISDLNDIKEVDRDTNVFPYIIPIVESGTILDQVDQSQGVIIGYEVTEKTEQVESNQTYYNEFPTWKRTEAMYVASDMTTNSGGEASNGKGGSMARFTLVGNYLYAVDNFNLKVFDVSVLNNPEFKNEANIGWNIETIFPYKGNLFIGSQTGMLIFELSDPLNPIKLSEFRHATSCDPVVVEGDYAYVTLRGGNLCGAIESQLDVIDISTLSEPKLLKEYPMTEPYGLGIDNSVLFVCDGSAGLKIYNASDPMKIDSNKIAEYPDVNAFDAIPIGDILIMIGVDGLFQYNYESLDSIWQMSHIPIYGD